MEDPQGNQHSRAQAGRGVLGKVLFICCYGKGCFPGMFLLPLLCSKRLLPHVVCWQSEPVDKEGGATCRVGGRTVLQCKSRANQLRNVGFNMDKYFLRVLYCNLQ